MLVARLLPFVPRLIRAARPRRMGQSMSTSVVFLAASAQPPQNTSPPGGWRGALDDVPEDDPRLDWPLLDTNGATQSIGWEKYNTERRERAYRRFHARKASIEATPLGRLCSAAKADDANGAAAALKAGADVNGRREVAGFGGEEPPLSVAAWAGSTRVARLLLRSGADLEQRDNQGITPLGYAAMGGSTAMIELLLSAGADVNAADKARWTPLFYAILSEDVEAPMTALLRAGADVRGTGLRAPLHHAVTSDNHNSFGGSCEQTSMTAAMRVLLDAGAAVDARAPEDESTALEAAVAHGNVAAVRLLLERGADPFAVASSKMERAEKSSDIFDSYAQVVRQMREAREARAEQPPREPHA